MHAQKLLYKREAWDWINEKEKEKEAAKIKKSRQRTGQAMSWSPGPKLGVPARKRGPQVTCDVNTQSKFQPNPADGPQCTGRYKRGLRNLPCDFENSFEDNVERGISSEDKKQMYVLRWLHEDKGRLGQRLYTS